MIRTLFLSILAVIILMSLGCNSDRVRSPEKVFEMYEDHQGAKYYSLPPLIANKVLPEEEKTHEVKQVLKEIKHLKVLVLDSSAKGEEAYIVVNQKLQSYIEKKDMKEMIHISRNGQEISINMREEEGQLKEVLVNIHGQDGFKGITMEGDLTIENIIQFVKTADFNELESLFLTP